MRIGNLIIKTKAWWRMRHARALYSAIQRAAPGAPEARIGFHVTRLQDYFSRYLTLILLDEANGPEFLNGNSFLMIEAATRAAEKDMTFLDRERRPITYSKWIAFTVFPRQLRVSKTIKMHSDYVYRLLEDFQHSLEGTQAIR